MGEKLDKLKNVIQNIKMDMDKTVGSDDFKNFARGMGNLNQNLTSMPSNEELPRVPQDLNPPRRYRPAIQEQRGVIDMEPVLELPQETDGIIHQDSIDKLFWGDAPKQSPTKRPVKKTRKAKQIPEIDDSEDALENFNSLVWGK